MKSVLITVIAAVAIPTAGAAQPITPSKARAVHDVKIEILSHYLELMNTSRPAGSELMPNARVGCDPLTDTVYKCKWFGQSRFYTVSGSAKVRFYKYGTDVKLYDVKCYESPGHALEYCS